MTATKKPVTLLTVDNGVLVANRPFRVAGTTFGDRQGVIACVNRTDNRRRSWVTLKRDRDNAHDASAVAVVCHTARRRHAQAGFLPRDLAALVAPLIDAGAAAYVKDWKPVSGGSPRRWGLEIGRLVIVESRTKKKGTVRS